MTDTDPAPAAQQPRYGQQAPYGQPNPYAQGPVQPRGLSITSMICGIAGLLFPFFLISLAAVIFGHLGRKREPAAAGFSLTGLITGYVGIALSALVVGIIVVFAIILPLIIFSSTTGSMDSFGTWEPGYNS